MTDSSPKSNSSLLPVILASFVILTLFIAGGVYMGKQRAKRHASHTDRQQTQQAAQNFAKVLTQLNGTESDDKDMSFHQIQTDTHETKIPGEKAALQFTDLQQVNALIEKLTRVPVKKADELLGSVSYIERIDKMEIPSEQYPPPTISRTSRIYQVKQPKGELVLEVDHEQVISAQFNGK